MAVRQIHLPWEYQPQELLELNRDHSLARGLLAYVVATPSGLLNVGLGDLGVSSGDIPTEASLTAQDLVGRRARYGTTSLTQIETVNTRGLPALSSSSKVTVYARGRVDSAGGNATTWPTLRVLLGIEWSSAASGIAIGLTNTNAIVGASALTAFRKTSNQTITYGKRFDAFAWNTGNQTHLEVDGVSPTASTTSSMSVSAVTGGRALIGYTGLSSTPGDRTVFVGGAWNRLLTSEEKLQLRDNPYVLVAPRRIWLPVPSAGGVAALTLDPSGSLLYKPAASGSDNKLYLTTAGSIAAKTAPGAGDRRISLSGGNWLAN